MGLLIDGAEATKPRLWLRVPKQDVLVCRPFSPWWDAQNLRWSPWWTHSGPTFPLDQPVSSSPYSFISLPQPNLPATLSAILLGMSGASLVMNCSSGLNLFRWYSSTSLRSSIRDDRLNAGILQIQCTRCLYKWTNPEANSTLTPERLHPKTCKGFIAEAQPCSSFLRTPPLFLGSATPCPLGQHFPLTPLAMPEKLGLAWPGVWPEIGLGTTELRFINHKVNALRKRKPLLELSEKLYLLLLWFVISIFISLRLMPPAFAGLEIASSMARSTTKSSSSNNSTILSIASSMARSTTKSNSNSSNNQQQQ